MKEFQHFLSANVRYLHTQSQAHYTLSNMFQSYPCLRMVPHDVLHFKPNYLTEIFYSSCF